jgi:hypothetical protein
MERWGDRSIKRQRGGGGSEKQKELKRGRERGERNKEEKRGRGRMTEMLKEERNVAHRGAKMKCNKDLRDTGRSKQKRYIERIKKQRDETETEADGKVTEADKRERDTDYCIFTNR